jgi:GTP cyclohydrolase II
MYTSNNNNLYHFLLDLKLGLPVALKNASGNYILLSSSENITNKSLDLMRTLSASSTSIIINNKRMSYLSKKNVGGELFSISFSKEISSKFIKDISSSMVNEKDYLEGSVISIENRQEIKNLIQLMKINQIIPSLVLCNIALNNEPELNSNLTNYNIKIYENIDLLTETREQKGFTIVSRSYVPISACKETEIVSFRSNNDYLEYFAIILKKGNNKKHPLVRIHSQCITGDILDSLKCDCGSQLKKSIEIMSNDGGILLYMPEEGRNIGLLNKLRSYEFQFHGIDTIDANYALGFDADQRRHENACKLLKVLGVGSIKLITNNPEKISQVQEGGIKVIDAVQIKVKVTAESKSYMETKKIRSGHNL